MNRRFVALLIAMPLALFTLVSQQIARADSLELKDGTQIVGTISKIEKGRVSVEVGQEMKSFDILGIKKMEFDIPRLEVGTSSLPLEHFLAGMQAQEMVEHVRAVEDAASDVRKLLDQTKKEWADRKSVGPGQVKQWEAAKERFRAPLSKYQEVLDDLYFHVLGKVDEYEQLMKEADAIYVGVKGWFNVGSPLIPRDMERLPLKKYVPSNWYDSIFYEGYNRGYNEAYQKYGTTFYTPYESPATKGTP